MILVLVGCSNELNIEVSEKITIYEMVSFSEVKDGSKIEIIAEDTIKVFVDVFNSAKKQSGDVDMADPHYRVDFDSGEYYLWLYDSGGTVMDTAETHTIYSVSARSAKKISEFIQ